MGSRYVVTGVQLGMIKSNSLQEKDLSELINEILKTQYIGYSTNDIKHDVTKLEDYGRRKK